MKKISIILLAFALAMTMSQCKKNEVQPVSNNEVVTITLDVNKNTGSKVVVNSATGTVDFESGDKIYVGSGGKYVGFLTHNGTNFSGNITNPTENQPLQFYFLGNVTPQETLSAGTTEECSVIISDQTEHLPVISCAASNENYVSGVTAYSAHLLNKCALVKFNVTTPSNSPICITGMKNKVTLDFSQNTMTPSIDGEGVIKLPAGAGENVEKWAILLPQEAMEEGEEGTIYSENGSYFGSRPAIFTISENGYLSEGLNLSVNIRTIPEGAINGLFSVSETQHVYFSQGNLQYQASNNIWRFAESQTDFVGTQSPSEGIAEGPLGTVSGSDNANISSTYSGWIDLFGWGTGNNPTNTSTSGYYTFTDWGNNSISNGGNTENQWRTLTSTEWEYLISIRNTSSGVRFAKATINDVRGVVILPDDWNITYYGLGNTNIENAAFTSNIISSTDWTSILEANGAVFLPAAGSRYTNKVSHIGIWGLYWSSTMGSALRFRYDLLEVGWENGYSGLSVRLVSDAE